MKKSIIIASAIFLSVSSNSSRSLKVDIENSSLNFEESRLFEKYILGRQNNYLAIDEIEWLLNSMEEDFGDVVSSF